MPQVSCWEHLGSNVWGLTASVDHYTSLRFAPTMWEDGDWDMEIPFDEAAEPFTAPGALALVEFRGAASLWRCVQQPRKSAAEGHVLQIGGPGAKALLGDETAWYDPAANLANQPAPPDQPVAYTGPAETVIRSIVRDNYVTRAARPLAVRPDQGRGADSRARGKMTNLKELVAKKARTGGVGFDVVLAKTSDTRGGLELRIWEPADLRSNVRLSELTGALQGWGATVTPPSLTEAILRRADGTFLRVTTQASIIDATEFGGVRSALVDGPDSYDDVDLVQAGEEALTEGASRVDVSLTVSDDEGLTAFEDYEVGDLVSATLDGGIDLEDNITSIQVTVEGEGLPDVVPQFGDGSEADPLLGIAQLIRSQDRRLRAQERKG